MARLVNLKVSGVQRLVKGLDKATKTLADPTPANKSAAIEYEKWIKKNFQAKGGLHEDTSLKWDKTSKATDIAKKRMGRSPSNILVGRTGNLRSRWFITANKRYGIIRSAVKYSYYHEYGKGVPKRKIFARKKQLRKIVDPVYKLWVKKAIKF